MPGGPFFNCYPGPFSNVRCRVKSLRIASTFIFSNVFIMNALAIHLYPIITFINLVIIRLAQNYRTIDYRNMFYNIKTIIFGRLIPSCPIIITAIRI